MKKRLAFLLVAVMAVSALAGCGDKKNTDTTNTEDTANAEDTADAEDTTAQLPSVVLKDYDVASLVTLGDYKGLEIVVAEPQVSEEEKSYYVDRIFSNGVSEENGVKDRPVADGDTVYISYVGTIDGEAFDGGTSEGTYLEIGSGSYIPGFEEGLVGVTPGETVDLNVTFPDPYENNPDMSGKEAVFSTTVVYIRPEMTDEVITSMGNENFSTLAELENYVQENLQQQAESDYDTQIKNKISDLVVANATYGEIPAELIASYKANVLGNLQSTATSYGVDLETYCSSAYGADSETIASNYGEIYAKQGLAFQAIADAENLNVDDDELETSLMEYATSYGLSTVDELLGDAKRDDFRDSFMFEKVMAFLQENTTVKSE